MDVSALPFNKHLGLEVSEATDSLAVVLQPSDHHLNHVGTVHATVIYGLAEAASGQSLLKHFSDLAESFAAVLRGSQVKYRRPAEATALIYAIGKLDEAAAIRFRERLGSRGRASIEIEVSVTQQDIELFSGTFSWFAALRES